MMKIKSIKFVGILSLMVLLSSCDLGLQEEFNFKPEAYLDNPFEKMTAWEWIQTRTKLLPTGKYDGGEFNYLIAAINKAGMVEEFNQLATKDRTYLLLNNDAFTGAGDVINIATGSATVPANETAEQTMNRVDTPAKLDKLKAVLRYHIITTYVLQVPTLYKPFQDYIFQTQIPGLDGLIALRRDYVWAITINSNLCTDLPTTATSEPEIVKNHNYQFKNGIGYVIADCVRNKPY